MNITLETINILEQSEQLAQMILQSDLGQAYLHSKMAMDQDPDAQIKIAEFRKEKEKFEEINKIGKFHPDYRHSSKRVRSLKRDMDMHATVADFKKIETQFMGMLEEVSRIIGHTVSDKIIIPSSNPLFKGEHQKNCGHEGGCSCSG